MNLPHLPNHLHQEIFSSLAIAKDLSHASDDEVRQFIQDSMQVESQINKLIDGRLDIDEYIESVEPFIQGLGTMDDYISEVELNLEETNDALYAYLVKCQQLRIN